MTRVEDKRLPRYGTIAKSSMIPKLYLFIHLGVGVMVRVGVNRVMHYVFNQTECTLKMLTI